MTADVALDFPFSTRSGIVSGAPVRAGQWTRNARCLNWLLGRSRCLIPATRVEGSGIAASATATFRVQLWPRAQARFRLWHVVIRAGVGDSATGTFTDPSGGALDWTYYDVDPSARVVTTGFFHVETLPSPWSSTPVADAFTVSNDASSDGPVYVESVQCWELPRLRLNADAADLGVDVDTLGAGLPIYDDVGESIGGVARGIGTAQLYDRRALFYWLRPANGGGAEVKSGTWTALYEEGPVLQPSMQFRAETLRPCDVYVSAYCDSGTAGEIRFTMTSGDALTLAISATSSTWVSGTIDVYAEDLSTSDGRRSTTWDIATVEVRRTSGAGSVWIDSICIAETRT